MANAKRRVAMSSVLAAIFLTGTKLTVGLMTGSLGLLSEAAHSGLDLLAAVMTWWAVHVSDRPADADHPYGHEKVENLAALFETLLLLLTCVWIIYEAVQRLFFKAVHVDVTVWSYGVIVLSIVIDFSRSRALYRVARATRSPALEADALHFSTDILSSLVVLAGLVFAAVGYPRGDAIAALGVALVVVWISVRLGRKAVYALADRVSAGHVDSAGRAALSVPAVLRAYDVRVREAGSRHFVDMKVAVDASTSLEQAHDVTEAVEKAVRGIFSRADVLVHVEPEVPSYRGLSETAAFLARGAGAQMHALELHETREGIHVDLHLEWQTDLPFAEAHELGSRVEEGIMRAFPDVLSVRSHLECAADKPVIHRDVTGRNPGQAAALLHAAGSVQGVLRCRELQILEGAGHWHVSLSCGVRPDLTLHGAHEVATHVEQAVRTASENVVSVIVHTEPGLDQPP